MAELSAIMGGKEMDFKYEDCKKEMGMIGKAFIETMIGGDSNGCRLQYPISTYSITRDLSQSDTENNHLPPEMTAKYETPYFSSYINGDMEPSDVWSMCCRLCPDLQELRRRTGEFFDSGESTGSVDIVTIDTSRIVYLSKDAEDFYRRLDHMMDIPVRSLKTKRRVITRLLDNSLYPYIERYSGSFENHFPAIGLIDMNGVDLNARWLGSDLTHEEAQKFTKDVLSRMREHLSDYQEMHSNLYNLETTPVESTTYRLARHDRGCYPDTIIAEHEGGAPYYTSSFHLSVDYVTDVSDTLDIQDELQILYISGVAFHAFLGEKLPDWQVATKLTHTIAENYKLPYYVLSPTYSICKDRGYLIGEHFTYPICGQEVEVYSQIIGYYYPVENRNEGKPQEYKNCTTYDVTPLALKKDATAAACTTETSEEKKETALAGVYLLITRTCSNCIMAQEFLKDADYQVVDAEENPGLTGEFGIMQVPTLALVKDEEIQKYANASSTRKFAETR